MHLRRDLAKNRDFHGLTQIWAYLRLTAAAVVTDGVLSQIQRKQP